MIQKSIIGKSNRIEEEITPFEEVEARILSYKESDVKPNTTIPPIQNLENEVEPPINSSSIYGFKYNQNLFGYITELPEDSRTYKTADDWTKYWKEDKTGRVMASAADYYNLFKQLKQDLKKGPAKKIRAESMIEILRSEFKEQTIRVNTKLKDYKNVESVIHHYECNRPELIKEKYVEIPYYNGAKLAEVLDTPEGLQFIHAYFNTEDDPKTIMQVMKFISVTEERNILISTETKLDRQKSFESQGSMDLWLYHQFRIQCSNKSNMGVSHGVYYQKS
jgi:hypothetical protein